MIRLLYLNHHAEPVNLLANQILIGRKQSLDIHSDYAKVCFDDIAVSRKHARLWTCDGRSWFIEDLGSSNGTFVDSKKITETTEINYGSVIQTGYTFWTIIPDDWLLINTKKIVIFASYLDYINYATFHCEVPVISQMKICNASIEKLPSFTLSLNVPDFCNTKILISELPPNHHHNIPEIRLQPDRRALKGQRDITKTYLQVSMTLFEKEVFSFPVKVSGFYTWAIKKQPYKSLAAFVCPHHPTVQYITQKVFEKYPVNSDCVSFRDFVRSYPKDAESAVMRSFYSFFLRDCELKWQPPHFDNNLQTLKMPHHIFDIDLQPLKGEGTCLDFSLLFASCLENAGLSPVIILLGNEKGEPCHALVGCWVGISPSSRPVIYNRDYLLDEMNQENLILLETTCAAKNSRENLFVDYQKAVISAQRQLTDVNIWKWICAIDIMTVRPPNGTICSIEHYQEPDVEKALYETYKFAVFCKSPTLELTHLLYGCIKTNTKIIRDLFESFGIQPDTLLSKLKKLCIVNLASGEPIPSSNYEKCLDQAKFISEKNSRLSIIREQDLLLALFETAPNSSKFCDLCRLLKIDIVKVLDWLIKHFFENNKIVLSLKLNLPSDTLSSEQSI